MRSEGSLSLLKLYAVCFIDMFKHNTQTEKLSILNYV
jgi:hypothetical protein